MTQPGGLEHNHTAPIVNIPAAVTDSKTGTWAVHKDLVTVIKPYEFEDHVGPPKAQEKFGDVQSWADFIKRFSAAPDFPPFLTWSNKELRAVLDFHTSAAPDGAGHCQFTASMAFSYSREWVAWNGLADGHGRTHQVMIEFLEDHGDDIENPVAGDLMNLLRSLKILSNKSLDIERREDGTQAISLVGDQKISSKQGPVGLPAIITINIPVFKGHKNAQGEPAKFRLRVRLRASVSNEGVPAFRFAIDNADATLEFVLADRVAAAQELLGDLKLLHAADA